MRDFPVITARSEWGRVFTDPGVWRPLVEHICRREGLGRVKALRAGYPGSNAVFIVNGTFVVKIMAPFWRTYYERELEIYRLLAPHPDLPTPAILGHGVAEGAQAWPYMILERLPGVRLGEVWAAVPPDNRLALAARTGRLIRALHATPLHPFTSMDTGRAAWERFLEERIAECVAHHRGRLPPHLLEQIPGYLAGAAPLFPATAPPRLLHGDITCDHLLLDRKENEWEITGFIDFGDAETGHPAYEFVAVGLDLFAADRDSRAACLRACLAHYDPPLDPDFERRMTAYTLLHRFSDIRACLARLGGPTRIKSLEQLQEVLWGGLMPGPGRAPHPL